MRQPKKCESSSFIVDMCQVVPLSLQLVLLCACTGPSSATASGETSTSQSSSTTNSTAPSSSTGSSSSSSSSSETGTSSSTTDASTCGDGVVDRDETCDDGNSVNGDGCNNDCQPSGAELWVYLKDGGKSDGAEGVTHTDDSILVAGHTFVEGEDFNGWIASLDYQGNLNWEKNLHKGDYDWFTSIGAAADGSFVVAGTNGKPDKAIWVRGFSASGEIIWSDDDDSGFGDDYARNIAVASDGRFAIAGIRSLEGGNDEIWTRLYDPKGTIQASSTYPVGLDIGWSVGPGVDFDEANDRIITGFTVLGMNYGTETLLASTYSGGAPTWTYSSSIEDSFINGVKVIDDGFITASYYGTEGFVVTRLDAAGEPIWSSSECIGLTGRSIAIDPFDQSIVAIGQGTSNDINIRLCKFSASGEFLWGKDIDSGMGNDRGWYVDTLDDGTIIAVGDQMGAGGRPDAWVAAYSP